MAIEQYKSDVEAIDAFVGRYPDTKTSALSGFIQADWNITEKLTFSGGIRQQLINVKLDDFVHYAIARGWVRFHTVDHVLIL